MGNTWLHTMDKSGMTPLERAMHSGHRVMADIMLQLDREDHAEEAASMSPLQRAASMGLTGAAVRSLLAYGANPTIADDFEELPLHKAVRGGHRSVVELLAEVCNVNTPDASGLTSLHWACLMGDVEMVSLLVRFGADSHMRNESMDGLSPLDIVEAMGYEELGDFFGGRATMVA